MEAAGHPVAPADAAPGSPPMNPAPGDLPLDPSEVEGSPQPPELAQWLPEETKWWTAGALRSRGGLDDARVTGSFLARRDDGRWSFRIFTADERDHVFGKPGTGTVPPTPT
jgi:hypothetical protein